jgi:hypothetical protein
MYKVCQIENDAKQLGGIRNLSISFKYILIVFLFLNSMNSFSQAIQEKKILYFIPGQGADERLYKNLELDSSLYDVHYIKWEIPSKDDDMNSYAIQLSKQIDTSKKFYLIGASLGGMIATEMNSFLKPEKVIIMSSAKCRTELPAQYKFQRAIPVYRIVPPIILKKSTFIAQPLFEPDRNKEKETCNAMLENLDPIFLKRSIGMIINWKRKDYDPAIIHIHGSNDHTIPIRNVNYTYLIKNGSHMMTLTRAKEIRDIILSEIEK